jgi:hypothetical protein
MPLDVSEHFAARPETLRAVRRFVGATLTDNVAVDRDAAVLLADELATSAVSHAETVFTVRVRVVPGAIRVEVGDAALASRDDLRDGDGGRRFALFNALANGWGTDSRSDKKVAWVEPPGGVPDVPRR